MRAVLLILILEAGADGCHDVDKHVAYSQNSDAIQTCKNRGGVPVEDVKSDGIHAFPVLVRCEFVLSDAIKKCQQSGGVPIVKEDGKSLESCTWPPTPERP